MSIYDEALALHLELCGKIEVMPKKEITDKKALSLLYSPGVAQPCLEIAKNPDSVYSYTSKANMVAVVTDGTAVLGLGDIGAKAALPVMEGKAALFKTFGGVDAFPICLDTTDEDKIVEAVKLIAPSFGGINLEDIAAPKCFNIEERLKKELDIPVFHDDQHGTAVVCLAALINALKLVGKEIGGVKIAINGIGSAGMAVVKLLVKYGARRFAICDSKGLVFDGLIEKDEADGFEKIIAERKKAGAYTGSLKDAVEHSDVFIGVSAGNVLSVEMAAAMNKDAVILALANPTPEIAPGDAKKAGARIVATGRSDYPNQVNNVLAFPGIFRGALDVRASVINDEMKIAAAEALSGLLDDGELNDEYIIVDPFDKRASPAVASAVAEAAVRTGVAHIH